MTYINQTFRTYMEVELREKIAQEIENAEFDLTAPLNTPIQVFDKTKIKFAAIARGQR